MRTQDTKNIHCNDYLHKIGAKFARTQRGTHGVEFVYHSPTREDEKPSLCVNLDRNIWSDVPAGEGGRLIELVCYTNGLMHSNVSEALSILDRLFREYRGSGRSSRGMNTPNHAVSSVLSLPVSPATSLKEKEGMRLVQTKDIYRYPLKHYLTERKIPLEIAGRYLREVEYQDEQGRDFYALGWKCGETYGLRSKSFKGFLGKGIDITVFDRGTSEVYLFEEIFDFLAYLAYTKRKEPPVTFIIMNSVAMRSKLEAWLRGNSQVQRLNCYFDNDTSGKTCLAKLCERFPQLDFHDRCDQYPQHKDFADWFVSR